MSMEEAIEVRDVWMMFNLSRKREERIKEYVINLVRGQLFFDRFWALKNVSFTLNKGDSLGVIGLNGSGKSTLMKLVAGVIQPTLGKIRTNGGIAPLIELGGGFDGNLSARENIYFTGSMHGLTKEFLDEKYEEIVTFAELEKFIDVPVKNFSSGMKARLGFAVATVIDPDILIVDEALSVGDAKFRGKCEDRIQEIISKGATVLFVSHSIEQVQKLCREVLWLDHGHVKMIGSAREICPLYKEFCVRNAKGVG